MNHCLFNTSDRWSVSKSWKSIKNTFIVGISVASLLSLSSCATESTTEPDPSTSNTTVTVDEFFTPLPSGAADDYYLLVEGEDDIEYSYFIDEEEYIFIRDYDDERDNDQRKSKYYKNAKKWQKRGHGYGDHNHIHKHIKGPHKYRGIYVGVKRRKIDWTDSLQLNSADKLVIDTAMRQFRECAKETLDSFKVMMKPFRENFRNTRMQIIVQLDSGLITRDSARLMLDSAIEKYEATTQLLRQSMIADLNVCLTELDLYLKARLDPDKYRIWVRNRGW